MTNHPPMLPIPLRLLDDRYGPGNVDEAEDDLIGIVQAVMGDGAVCGFHFDTAHANPWFHQLLLQPQVGGQPATAAQMQAMMQQLATLLPDMPDAPHL